MIHRIGCGLVIGPTLTRHVAAGVAVARKFGETTTAHFNANRSRHKSVPIFILSAVKVGQLPLPIWQMDSFGEYYDP